MAAVPEPLVFSSIPIHYPFLEHDVFKVNMGKVKSTYGSPVGFCVKNAKGVIPDEYKKAFHNRGVQRALCDLYGVLSWDLAILEGVPISELGVAGGIGPTGVCTSALVLDMVFAGCMHVPIGAVEHLQVLGKRLHVRIDVLDDSPSFKQFRSLWRALRYSASGTAKLAEQYGVRIDDDAACTACVESLAKACKRLEQDGVLPDSDNIVIGCASGAVLRGADPSPRGTDIYLGKCAFDRVAMIVSGAGCHEPVLKRWRRGHKIDGCPPTIDSIVEQIGARHPERRSEHLAATRSERILRGLQVNPLQAQAGRGLYPLILRSLPKEAEAFAGLDLDTALACEVVCAAICHQMNWDFLRRRVADLARSEPQQLLPSRIAMADSAFVARLLKGYERPERIRPNERSEMLRSLAGMFQDGAYSFSAALGIAHGGITKGPSDIVAVLGRAKVFAEDPEQKKLQVLLHNLAAAYPHSGIDAVCQPAIDYHIMRLYVRRGDVSARTRTAEEFLFGSTPRKATTVTALRVVVAEALRGVSVLTRIPLQEANKIEWWIGRSVCTKRPDCEMNGSGGSWLRPHFPACPFKNVCYAFNSDPRLLAVREPQHEGRYY